MMRSTDAMDHPGQDRLSARLKSAVAEISAGTSLPEPPWVSRPPLGADTTAHRRLHRRHYALMGVVTAIMAAALMLAAVPRSQGSSPGAVREVHVSGITLTQLDAATTPIPHLTSDQAGADALAAMEDWTSSPPSPGNPPLPSTGWSVASASFEGDVTIVNSLWINWELNSPESLWVVTLSAPAQDGFPDVGGLVLVNDTSATVSPAGGPYLLLAPGAAISPATAPPYPPFCFEWTAGSALKVVQGQCPSPSSGP